MNTTKSSRKSPEILVPLVGLLYSALYLVYLLASTPGILSGAFGLILVVFIALFLVSGYGVWRRNRFAFIGAAVLSFLFIAQFGFFLIEALSNPSTFSTFFGVMTVFFSLIATVVYSILGARTTWRKGTVAMTSKTVPRSSVFAFLVLGFIVGGLVVGALAGGTEARLLANTGKTSDIVVVQGAGNEGNAAGYYAPATFTAKLGPSGSVTVTWSNGDGSTHTVTSTPGTQFDHTLMSGDSFSYTFTQAGTYSYYCTIHPWMKGTVVITSG